MTARRSCRFAAAALGALALLFASPAIATAAPPSDGYRLLGGDGGVFGFHAPFFGSATSPAAQCAPNTTDRTLPDGTCLGFASTPNGDGYWVLNVSTGRIAAFGAAQRFGEPADDFVGVPREFVPTGVAIVSTPTGQGYWVLQVGLSGGGAVAPFGDAKSFGDTFTLMQTRHVSFSGEPVALAATPDGKGYWEVHSDGGVFAFGDAPFRGSMSGRHLDAPIVGIAPTADGKGYWLVGADGGVFAFGNAAFGGSLVGKHINGAVVGIARDPNSGGYWLAARDGGVFAFGGAPFFGSLGAVHLARPIFAISAATPGP
jgi:hypothetical protein